MTKKLLLADDSITIQKVIGIIFATEDYQLLMSDDGNEAFEKAREEHPDLVIADVSMPGKDGFELCQAIKGEPQLAHTSVLLLPGTFDHFDEGRAEAVGADGWITKPFESQALLDKVAQLLEAEPVSLADAGAAPATEVAEPVFEASDEPGAVEAVAAVDENVLGLGEVEEQPVADAVEEDSPDDIWDAVSFEEEDLQRTADVAPAVEEDVIAAEEEVQVEELSETSEVSFEAPAEVADLDTVEPAAESVTEDVDTVDFSAPAEPETSEDESGFVIETDTDEPLELIDELEEETVEGFETEQPLELEEEAIVEDSVETTVSGEEESHEALTGAEFVAAETEELPIVEPLEDTSLDEDEEILDLAEDDILDEEPDEEGAEVPALPLEAVDELVGEPEVEGDAFVLEDEVAEGEELAPVAEFEAAEPSEEAIYEPVAEEDEAASIAQFEADELPSEVDETNLELNEADEEFVTAEEPVAEFQTEQAEVAAESVATEDDGFYYDAPETEEEEESFVAPAATVAAAAGMAGVVASTAVSEESQIEQVEQQLRELSEDELKEVVSKVAGPTIEKLANEMLEQIVWEVVPDLAESMIREEIRKIRQGAE